MIKSEIYRRTAGNSCRCAILCSLEGLGCLCFFFVLFVLLKTNAWAVRPFVCPWVRPTVVPSGQSLSFWHSVYRLFARLLLGLCNYSSLCCCSRACAHFLSCAFFSLPTNTSKVVAVATEVMRHNPAKQERWTTRRKDIKEDKKMSRPR